MCRHGLVAPTLSAIAGEAAQASPQVLTSRLTTIHNQYWYWLKVASGPTGALEETPIMLPNSGASKLQAALPDPAASVDIDLEPEATPVADCDDYSQGRL
jgi:hypothetical protein